MPDDTLDIPVLGGGENDMAEGTPQFTALHNQNMATIGIVSNRFLSDAATVSKAADYRYLQDMNNVSLPEALGAREVGSRVNPSGPVPATSVG